MYLILCMEVTALVIAYFFSKNKYSKELMELEVEDKRIKILLPLGLYMEKAFNLRLLNGYKQHITSKIKDLTGSRHIQLYARYHLAKTILILVFIILFLTFVGTQMEPDFTFGIFSIAFPGIILFAMDRQIDKQIKQRKTLMQMDLPEFLNKLVLMVNAGLTVSSALSRIVKSSNTKRPLYEELKCVMNEMSAGKPEIQAYEDFARRCRLQEVTMFVSTLLQNLKKGNDELVPILKLQANTCWEGRKLAARKLGEEASTKLLFPMMIIFVAIMAMVMTPAVLQLNFN